MIFLVRHAHSDYSTDEMRGLSARGFAAAGRIADSLSGCEIALIVSSPYTRAVQTVAPLAQRVGIQIQIDQDLRERRLSVGPVDDLRRWLEPTWLDFGLAYPGGESSADAQARVSRAIHQVARAAGTRNAVVASHGNALALFLHTLDPRVDYGFWAQMSVPDVYAIDTSHGPPWSYHRYLIPNT